MARVPNDYDLNFLKKCSKEELEPLVGILLGTDDDGNIDETGRISSELHQTDHTKYVNEIIEEIQKFGGNAIGNALKGYGEAYHTILCKVAKKLKVNFDKKQSVCTIEKHLLDKVLTDIWENMSESERKRIIRRCSKQFGIRFGGVGTAALIYLFRAGGFKSYVVILTLVNMIAKMVLGRGLTLLGNIMLVRALAILAGPWGWAGTVLWTLYDIAGPAYSVIVPATVYIAALRNLKAMEKYAEMEVEDSQPIEKDSKKKLPAPKKNASKTNVKKTRAKVKAAAKSTKSKNTSSLRS